MALRTLLGYVFRVQWVPRGLLGVTARILRGGKRVPGGVLGVWDLVCEFGVYGAFRTLA